MSVDPGSKNLASQDNVRLRAQSSIGPSFYGGSPRRPGLKPLTETLTRPTAESSKAVLSAKENLATRLLDEARGQAKGMMPPAKNLLRKKSHADHQTQNAKTSADSSKNPHVDQEKTTKVISRPPSALKVKSGTGHIRPSNRDGDYMKMPTETLGGNTERRINRAEVDFTTNKTLSRDVHNPNNSSPSASRQDSAPKRGRESARKRHLSMPVTLADHTRTADKGATVARIPRPPSRNHALQELTAETGLSQKALRQISQVVKGVVDDQLPRHLENLITPEGRVPDVAQTPNHESILSPKSRKKQKRAADRQLHPPLSTEVPEADRLSDSELINLGKEKDGYSRHRGAPYAFGVKGRLRAYYTYLLNKRPEDGSPGWTVEQQRRVRD